MMSRSWLAMALLAALLLAAVLVLMPESAEAADREIFGNWDISGGTTHVTGETIDVRGNVVVRSGGTLKLEDCQLAINGSGDGQRSLEVMRGGRLEAYGTTIHGNDAYVSMQFHDDVLVDGCRIEHIYGTQSSATERGLLVDGGTASFKDTVIRDGLYHGIFAQANVTLENVTVEDVARSNVYVYNWGAPGGYSITIRDSHITGTTSSEWYKAGVFFYVTTSGPAVETSIVDSNFRNCNKGIYFYGLGGVDDAIVDGCEFLDCKSGIEMYRTVSSGDYTFRYNNVNANDMGSSMGMAISLRENFAPTLQNNVVEHVALGYTVYGRWGQSHDVSLGNIAASNVTRGLVTEYNIQLTLHNSSFKDVSSTAGCFVARNSSTITVIDTVHPWGSGTVEHANSWIRAYMDMSIRGARWKDGDPIMEGDLVIENVTRYEVTRFNLSDLRSQDVAAWEVDDSGRRTSRYLYPAVYHDGRGFRGERFDIKDYTPTVFRLVDDYVPVVEVTAPSEGEAFDTDRVWTRGRYDELGSGLHSIEYSMDGSNWTPLGGWSGGGWDLNLTSLPEGETTLSVRGTDGVGNVGEVATVTFLVDTIAPTIEFDPYPGLVNVTSVAVTGRTEPLATLAVDGEEHPLADNGSFTVRLALAEGRNEFIFNAMDRAGHFEEAKVSIVRDTEAPDLSVTGPVDGSWTKDRTVQVAGTTEEGALVSINGEEVNTVEGAFGRDMDLEEGDNVIRVVSVDEAGNPNVVELVLHVDWTAPGLSIVEPQEPEVHVRESSIYISGDVDDPAIDQVYINGEMVTVTSGRFVKQFTVLEGTTEFVINVTDMAGNSASEKVVVIRDLTPPTYDAELTPQGGELVYVDGDLFSTAPAVEVHLTLSELANVTAGTGEPLPATTDVRVRFDLEEGTNTLELYIVDIAGNQAPTYRQRVFVDTTAPTIEMYSPQPGTRTKEDTITINGVTEEGSTVTINGESVALRSGGEFRHIVALVDGRNEFSIQVVDAMGNSANTSVSVLRESEVTTPEPSTTGATGLGFLIGLAVGIAVTVAFFMARQRGRGGTAAGEEPPARPEGDEPPRPPRPPQPPQPHEPPGPGGPEGWEEF